MSAVFQYNKMRNWNDRGITLIELMMGLFIGAIIAVAAFAAYSVQSKTFSTQRQVSRIQQDLRGALYMMESDLLNACRDPNLTNRYTFTDIRPYNFAAGQLDTLMAPALFVMPAAPSGIYFASFPVLEFTSLRWDFDGDGIGDRPATIRYQVYDFNNDGRLDLGRRVNLGNVPPLAILPATPTLIAEGVIAVGYAFAYNLAPNGRYQITRTPPLGAGDPLGNIIWAVDTNGDNFLDTNIDIDGDGLITTADDISGDGIINALDNATAALPAPAPIANAVAVRIWILMQSANQSPENVVDNNQYVVADRIIPPNPNGFQDRFKRRVKTVTVALRNYRKS